MKNKKSNVFRIGDKIQWQWMGRSIEGIVKEIYFEAISKEIKGAKIKRNGSAENPAYLVQSNAGNIALKLHSELQTYQSTPTPKMFSK